LYYVNKSGHKYGELQKLGSSRAPPLGIGAWLTARNTPLPTSYSAEFSHCVPNRMSLGGVSKTEDAGARSHWIKAWLIPRNMPLPTCIALPNSCSKSNGTSVIIAIRLKNLSRLPRSLKIFGTSMGQLATYDFLLTFRSTMGLFCTITKM